MTKVKVVFAPGSMDGFEGTQEELDALVAELQSMLANGIPDDATPVTPEEEEAFIKLMQDQVRRTQ
jgi:hypothetical protein